MGEHHEGCVNIPPTDHELTDTWPLDDAGAGLTPLAIPVFATLGLPIPPGLAQAFRARKVRRGEALLRVGERWDRALLVERGILRMYFARRDGREFNKNFHAEGALLLPVTRAMADEPSLFHIAAVEDGQLRVAPMAEVLAVLRGAGLWERLRAHLAEGLLSAKLAREHELLTLDGRARWQRLAERQPELLERVPLHLLASYLGLTDVSLSRIRRGLRDSGER